MQLTLEQFYFLLIALPSLLTGLIVYFFTAANRNRIISALEEKNSSITDQFQHAEKNIAVRNQQIINLHTNNQELKNNQNTLKAKYVVLEKECYQLKTELKTSQISHLKERQYTDEKLTQLEINKSQLKKDFELLAQQILKSTQQEFSTESKNGLELFLSPFRQQINDFKHKVETIHSNDLKQREELKTELKHLQDLNLQMTNEAHELSTALKGQKKMQGNWGELILENVLDRSGLQIDKDYKREVSFNTEKGRFRPDVIVYLPDNKHLVIDSKVSLNAYTRFVNAQSELEKSQAIKDHIQAISARIKELSDKNYFDLPGLKSPEMVFMFIPIESAFVEAIRADENLFQLAIEQQVLVTTPTTLLTSLNIIRQLWRFEDQNKHTAKLADQAGKVYNQLRLFLESMESLGTQLDKSRSTYETAMRQFISGKGNLVKRVEEFQKLGVSVKKELPPELVEKASLELDLIELKDDF
ncbi:MAG: DNA recombination protein RmuC [Gammaproteobacteria bacterium]|jgi:DNA recombination protein RmuC|nr:DNA recombination protein RmuC [Gammaproteobacteria bacterium]MBT3722374.1 DNA recombination protein RmuC [Gammaproteobacteria bacterium]MBT4075316.1 DNA recombination protein RmuC [Gammaproteobacteria bacterium]MBT4193240.1 DNA recombination protein RmuC [Gammaproteobacteria bacterium]MBT4450947.1 DNA recombination protein RmuC [Gammaproteobacteria bacterium]